MSKTENLVIAISQGRNDQHFSYLVYRFFMSGGSALLFLVEVKGHLRSPEIKLQKPRKWLVVIQVLGVQRSCEVKRGQIVSTS